MKQVLPAVFAALITLGGYAQDTASVIDPEPTGKPHQDMLLVDLNWDYLLGLESPVKQEWYGRGISLAGMYDHPLNKDGNVSFAFGVGFSSHNYYTNALVLRTDSVSSFTAVPDSIKSKGKLSVNYFDIPVEFRFRTNANDKGYRWKIALGGRVGYLLDAHEKTINAQDVKIKTYDYPHITQWRYGVVARVGYGSMMLSAFYSLSTFFETGKSLTDQNALSVGITIVPF